MDNTNDMYDQEIEKIRKVEVKPKNALALTDSIMEAIEQSRSKTSHHVLYWIRPALTAAALFLFGLFFYQQSESSDQTISYPITSPSVIEASAHVSNCFTKSSQEKVENKSLLQKYLCYMHNSSLENRKEKLFLLKQLSRYQ